MIVSERTVSVMPNVFIADIERMRIPADKMRSSEEVFDDLMKCDLKLQESMLAMNKACDELVQTWSMAESKLSKAE